MLKRVKRRYLAIHIDSSHIFEADNFLNAIWNAIVRMFGEHGASHSGLALIDYEKERRLAIVRVNLGVLDQARASLATLTRIGDKPVALHVFAISGTLKALRRRFR